MRAGTLDRRITLQRRTAVQDPAGEPLETWADIATGWPASLRPLIGTEALGGEQARARQQVDFRVRWSEAISDLSPLDRVVYPADLATDSPSLASSVYDILAVNEISRRRELQIIAARNADVAP